MGSSFRPRAVSISGFGIFSSSHCKDEDLSFVDSYSMMLNSRLGDKRIGYESPKARLSPSSDIFLRILCRRLEGGSQSLDMFPHGPL